MSKQSRRSSSVIVKSSSNGSSSTDEKSSSGGDSDDEGGGAAVGSRSNFSYAECKAVYVAIKGSLQEDLTSRSELLKALQQSGRSPSKSTIAKYWTIKTSKINFDEFCKIMKQEKKLSVGDLMKAFHALDTDKNGYLSKKELTAMLTTKGEKMSEKEVEMALKEADINKDGKLDYAEFCKIIVDTADKCLRQTMKNAKDGGSSSNKPEKRKTPEPAANPPLNRRKSTDVPQPLPVPRGRKGVTGGSTEVTLQPVKDVCGKIQEPKHIKKWHRVSRKGCFYVDDDEDGAEERGGEVRRLITHQYDLTIKEACNVFIKAAPITSIKSMAAHKGRAPAGFDVIILVTRVGGASGGTERKSSTAAGSSSHQLVTFTEKRDDKGTYYTRADLAAGKYRLIPFSVTAGMSGHTAHSAAQHQTVIVKKDKEGIHLTKHFKSVLSEIFDMCDLDGNGLLNREEFNLFNVRTSGDSVDDDEWNVVEENVELREGELSRRGFEQLHQMEAEDNEGDADDLWLTLHSMGYNKQLELDEAWPFTVEVCSDSDVAPGPTLALHGTFHAVCGGAHSDHSTHSTGQEDPLIESVLARAEPHRVRSGREVNLYLYTGDARATILIQNKCSSVVEVTVSCEQSRNCVSPSGSLTQSLTVPANTSKIALHLLAEHENKPWHIKWQATITKG